VQSRLVVTATLILMMCAAASIPAAQVATPPAGQTVVPPPAQAPAVPAAADEQAARDAKYQAKAFELFLRAAVERAGTELAMRAKQQMPEVALQFAAEPVITSVALPEYGLTFSVRIPEILGSSTYLWNIMASRPKVGAARVSTNEAGRAVAVTREADPFIDPDKEYSTLSRQVLIDAMLDNSHALVIPEGQYLVVTAIGLPTTTVNPLTDSARWLILRIKSEDLTALRQGRITRDEAKRRIMESRY